MNKSIHEWIVAHFDDPHRVEKAIADLQQEGFQKIGIVVQEDAARFRGLNVEGILLEHVTTSAQRKIVAGGLAEMQPEHVQVNGLQGTLAELGVPEEEIKDCLEAIDQGQVVLLIQCDDRYSEGLAILNVHGADAAMRESTNDG